MPTPSARGPTDVVVTAIAVPVVESIRYVHPARTFAKVTPPPQVVATAGTGGAGGDVQAAMLNVPPVMSLALASRNSYVYEPTASLIGPTIPLTGTVKDWSPGSMINCQLAQALLNVTEPPHAVATTGVGGVTGTTYLLTKPQFQTSWPSLGNETFRSWLLSPHLSGVVGFLEQPPSTC